MRAYLFAVIREQERTQLLVAELAAKAKPA